MSKKMNDQIRRMINGMMKIKQVCVTVVSR